jgi:flavodoxin
MSKALIVYYSRTGKTRIVAQKLSELTGADLGEIQERKSRTGAMGFLSAGKDTVFKSRVALTETPDPTPYDVVILGMPVWAFQPPAAMREYLRGTPLSDKTICAFCTSDGSGGKGTFKALEKILGEPLATTLDWLKPKEDDPALQAALEEWGAKLTAL